jgi:hypothetical protein
MERLVLKRGGLATASTIEAVANLPGLRVLDCLGRQALLVEVEAGWLGRHAGALDGWTCAPEVELPAPWATGQNPHTPEE